VTLYNLIQKYELGTDWRRNVESLRGSGSGGSPVGFSGKSEIAAASDRSCGE
jgi:hypothetical protein